MIKSRAPRRPARKTASPSKHAGLWGKDLLLIERMSQEGRGVAMRSGKVVFVRGALAGERVHVQCTAAKRDYDEAELLEVAADSPPSAARVLPACPVYQQCGGCNLQHWSIAAQRDHKQATLQAMLQTTAPQLQKSPLQLEPPIHGETEAFRHRLRLVVTRSADRRYVLGLREHRSHQAVHIPHCLVANAALNALLATLPAWLLGLPDLQGLREIDIDADSHNALGLCLYFAAHPGAAVLDQLRSAATAINVAALRVRLYAQRKASNVDDFDDTGGAAPQLFQQLLAEGELRLQVAAQHRDQSTGPALELAYQPGDFTQTHWEVNAALVQRAIDWLQPRPDERALDLFCGIGNFALPLARDVLRVDAYEGDSNMTRRTNENAQRNGLTNITARTLDLMAPDISLPRADIAIVDPPRAGAKAVCEALARAKVKRIVYVSCHPATLARDARILQSAGFKLKKVSAVDMFTHTGHSEVIVLFERK